MSKVYGILQIRQVSISSMSVVLNVKNNAINNRILPIRRLYPSCRSYLKETPFQNVGINLYGQNLINSSDERMYSSMPFTNTLKDKLHKFGFVMADKYSKKDLKNSAFVLLNGIYMRVSHNKIREFAGLEDSFNMWVRVVFIHLWVLFTRLRREGRDGDVIVIALMKMFWNDLDQRLAQMQKGLKTNLEIKTLMKQYYNEIYSSFMFIDEGVTGSDIQLAASLHSLIYCENSFESEAWHLESLVHYTRYLIKHLDEIDMHTMVYSPHNVNWVLPDELMIS